MPKASSKVAKVPVTERALIQRINRRIHDDDLIVKKSRSARMVQDCGEYYVLDWRLNGVILTEIDLEDYAREVGALQPFEELAV